MQLPRPEHDDRPGVPPELVEPTAPVERERLLNEAEAEIEAGRGIGGEKVSAWLRELANGRPAKAPWDP